MAEVSFHAFDASSEIINLAGSGLGFFGSSFGQSVEVGAYQDTTYITDGAGSTEGDAVINTKWNHAASGINSVVGTDPIDLQYIPNRLATLNVRFTNDTAVKTQNVKLRIFDRSNINNGPSGVVCKVAELRHTDTSQAVQSTDSDSSWSTPTGSAVIMDLVASPGTSGLRPDDANTEDTRHDHYLAISASPSSVGSKSLFGLFCQLEYL